MTTAPLARNPGQTCMEAPVTTTETNPESTAIELTGSRYLSRVFAPVDKEVTAFDLPVEGEIPKAIDGLIVRNGPNPINPDPSNYHWFIGNGMLHGVELSDGKAKSYRNRWVRTDNAAADLGE